jgi:sugar phosphate isomerase/epimerase
MNRSKEAFMRMGIVHFMAFPELGSGKGPWVETVCEIARDPFFSAVEITHIEDEVQRSEVRDICRLAKLSVSFGAHPIILGKGLDINSLDEAKRVQGIDVLKELVDEAIFMGAESFVILSGKDPGPDKREKALEILVESIGELCDYSRQKGGPTVIAEVFDCEVDKCCLLGPGALAQKLARNVAQNHDNFGLLVDLSHIPLLNETPRQALEPVKDYLRAAHLGNAVMTKGMPGCGDNHPIFGTPGSVNDVPEVTDFLRTMVDIGFLNGVDRPIVSFEVKPLPGQQPQLVIANAKRVMEHAWALV